MKAYLLKTTTAVALLGIGGITGAGLTAKAGWADTKTVTVAKDIPSTNPVLSSIWTNVDNAMCPEVEAQMGWDDGECTVEPGTVMSITRGETDDHVSVSFRFATTVIKGPPE